MNKSEHIIRNSGRDAAAGETPHVLVWWVLAIPGDHSTWSFAVILERCCECT